MLPRMTVAVSASDMPKSWHIQEAPLQTLEGFGDMHESPINHCVHRNGVHINVNGVISLMTVPTAKLGTTGERVKNSKVEIEGA